MARFEDTLNGKLLFEEFGCVIQTGTQDLLEFARRKETPIFNWPERNGSQRDLSKPRFNDGEIKLQMAILADDEEMFWARYKKLTSHLSRPGWQILYIHDHERDYRVSYLRSGDMRKSGKRLKNVDKIFVSFSVYFTVEHKALTIREHVLANIEDYENIADGALGGWQAWHLNHIKHLSGNRERAHQKAIDYLSRQHSVILTSSHAVEAMTGTGQNIRLPSGYFKNKPFKIYVPEFADPHVQTLHRAFKRFRKKRVEIVVIVYEKDQTSAAVIQARVHQAYEKFKGMFAYRFDEIITIDKEFLDELYP